MGRLKIQFQEFKSVIKNELTFILKDPGVLLVMVGAIFIYSILYSLAYKNEVLRDVPIAVVDQSNSPSSQVLIRAIDAASNMKIAYKPASLDEAKHLFMSREVNGVIVIPHDYEKKVLRMEKAAVSVYADASYFLMYRQVFSDAISAIDKVGTEIEWNRFVSSGKSPEAAKVISNPVQIKITNLFNPYGGYGSFVMPAIIILILQQTLLIAIGMIGGTWREQNLYKQLIPTGESRLSILPVVFGKAVTYLLMCVITISYVLGVHYNLFGYPANGAIGDLLQLLLPYLLSVIFLGIMLSTLFRYRENSILFLLFTSIPFLLLTGISLPQQAMPQWLFHLAKIVPSSNGVDAFIRIQSMGATLVEVITPYRILWALTIVYFIGAYFGIRYRIRKA
ncbi:MAG: ABC transporter permease [Bacteroidales bacterium]